MKTLLNYQAVVDAFVRGDDVGLFNDLATDAKELKYRNSLIAKKVNEEFILASSKQIPEDINDNLLTSILGVGKSFRRIKSFDDLLNLAKRKAEIDSGDYDSLMVAASIYNIEIDKTAIAELTTLNSEVETLKAKIASVHNTVARKREGLLKPLNDYIVTKREERRKEELSKLSEEKRKAVEAWDSGRSNNATFVEGAGGGSRLRTVERGGEQKRIDVQSTSSYRTSLNQVKRAFNIVAPYIWGNKADEKLQERKAYQGYCIKYLRDHPVRIQEEKVSLGCQQITISELERFATTQGWPLDGSPVTV